MTCCYSISSSWNTQLTTGVPQIDSGRHGSKTNLFARLPISPTKVKDAVTSMLTSPTADAGAVFSGVTGDPTAILSHIDMMPPSIVIGSIQNCIGTDCQGSPFIGVLALALVMLGAGTLLGAVLPLMGNNISVRHACSWASVVCLAAASALLLGQTAAAFVISTTVSRATTSLNKTFLASAMFKTITLDMQPGSAPVLYLLITIISVASWVLVMYVVGRIHDQAHENK